MEALTESLCTCSISTFNLKNALEVISSLVSKDRQEERGLRVCAHEPGLLL